MKSAAICVYVVVVVTSNGLNAALCDNLSCYVSSDRRDNVQ